VLATLACALGGCHGSEKAQPAASARPGSGAAPSSSAAGSVGGGLGWHEVERLSIEARSDSQQHQGDEVGRAVALSSKRFVVGATRRTRADGAPSGAIVLSRETPSKIEREIREKGVAMGFAVGVSGDAVLVGAPYENARGKGSGAVFSYQGAGAGSKLVGSGVAAGAGFGDAIAVSGTSAIVGQFASSDAGGAWIFSKGERGFQEVVRLRVKELGKGSGFGAAVALDADRAVVGASHAGGASKESGAIFVFQRGGETFRQTARVEPKQAIDQLHFGSAVAVSGDRIVASGGSESTAAVWVFSLDAKGAWAETQKLSAPAKSAAFGATLALSGDELFVADPQAKGASGVVFVYRAKGAAFEAVGELTAPKPEPNAWFGASLALDAHSALVGAPSENGHAGAVYVFAR
jgi:hypothetical protein